MSRSNTAAMKSGLANSAGLGTLGAMPTNLKPEKNVRRGVGHAL